MIMRALFALSKKGAVLMITYSELFLLLTLIVSVIALVVNITKKNNRPVQSSGYF